MQQPTSISIVCTVRGAGMARRAAAARELPVFRAGTYADVGTGGLYFSKAG